jgi:CheY-like chemotaxis protein
MAMNSCGEFAPVTQRLRRFAVTAFANSVDRARALQADYNMHFGKPFESQELVKAVAAKCVSASASSSLV